MASIGSFLFSLLGVRQQRNYDTLRNPTLVNTDCDLAALLDRLTRPRADRAVSFLLSGPLGSGKSARVRDVAGRMGLRVLRASDLQGAFVGGTERNIAEARNANVFLVFDEAESLLLDHADAVRSWEIRRSSPARCI